MDKQSLCEEGSLEIDPSLGQFHPWIQTPKQDTTATAITLADLVFNLEKTTTRRSHRRVGYEELRRVIAIMRQDENFSQRFPDLMPSAKSPIRFPTHAKPAPIQPASFAYNPIVQESNAPKAVDRSLIEFSNPYQQSPSSKEVRNEYESMLMLPTLDSKLDFHPSPDSKPSPSTNQAEDALVEDSSLQNLFGYHRNHPRSSYQQSLTPDRLSTQASSRFLDRPKSRRIGSKLATAGRQSVELRETKQPSSGENSVARLLETPSSYLKSITPIHFPVSVGHNSLSPIPPRRVKKIKVFMQNLPNIGKSRFREDSFLPKLKGKRGGFPSVSHVRSLRSGRYAVETTH